MNLTALKAIRLKCMECSCDNAAEVKLCPVISCPLWPYRSGRKPDKEEAAMYAGKGIPLSR